jgi:uncharacterized protein YifN (PemK superfamily)
MNNVKEQLQKAIEQLNDFCNCFNSTEKKIALACDYFRWVRQKTQMIMDEDTFQEPKAADLKRGSVCWIHFGFNVGEEFGGKHPGIVLRKGGKTIVVVPLTTKQPTQKQLESGPYVEVDKVFGFKRMTRWVNVLNMTPVSIQRIDYNSDFGDVKGYVLDNITTAIMESGLLGRSSS